MTIDPDVARVAQRWGLDPALLQAVVRAEGNILKAVRCTYPKTKDRAAALEILCRSCVHAMSDFVGTHTPAPFVDFWGARWAPQGAANDPQQLNAHWVHNVLTLWQEARRRPSGSTGE